MFANVVRLELIKQRKSFLSGLFLAIIFLFFIFVDSLIHSRNILEVLRDIIGYFAVFGISGLLILTGPVAGAHLRSESVRNAEEPFPFSPVQKVFGAYLTSLFYVLIGSIFFFGLVVALNSFSLLDLTLTTLIGWHHAIRPEVFILLILQFHLLSFLFAYWINQTVLGTALAGLVVGSEIVILLQAYVLKDAYWFAYPASSWLTWVFGAVVGLIGACAALFIIAKRIERSSRTFLWPGFVAAITIFAGCIFLLSGFFITSYVLQNKLVPANLSWPDRLIESPRPQPSGAFFYSMSGDLVQITPERKIVLRNTGFILNPNKTLEIGRYYSAGDSSFFLLKKEFGKYEIWKASGEGKFEHYLSFLSPKIAPEFMFQCGDDTCLYSFAENENFIVFSKLASTIPQNQNIGWQRVPIPNGSLGFATILEHVLSSQVEKGRAARLSDSKNILTKSLADGKILHWNLPGVAVTPKFLGSTILPAFEKDGEPYFVIPVSANGKTSFIECLPDGSVQPAWNDSFPASDELSSRNVAGGGLVWLRWTNKRTELRIIGNEGTLYRPLKLPSSDAIAWPVPLKIDGTSIWFLLGRHLMKADLANGKILSDSGPLSDRFDYWSYLQNPTTEGVYYVRDNRICLIDWNGKIRDLGPASVN